MCRAWAKEEGEGSGTGSEQESEVWGDFSELHSPSPGASHFPI